MAKLPSNRKPLVSVILPVLNEGRRLNQTIQSLLDQENSNFDLEVLVVDGQSTDGSAALVAEMARINPQIRLLFNERRRTPFALNIGLREARGEYVCVLGAHNIYEKEYISVCLGELVVRGAAGCSGRVVTRPANATLEARLVAWALAHPFGSSGKSFRTQKEGFVDTVPYPVMRKDALVEVGGYDETLFRNQDNDMNQRLRSRGYKLFCTWKTVCFYHPKSTVKQLLSYAFGNGYWNALSLEKNFSSMRLRHFVPFLFVVALITLFLATVLALSLPEPYRGVVVGLLPMLLIVHLSLGGIAGLQTALRQRTAAALLLPLVFLAFHISYGYGTLYACLRKRPDRGHDLT